MEFNLLIRMGGSLSREALCLRKVSQKNVFMHGNFSSTTENMKLIFVIVFMRKFTLNTSIK